MILPSRYNFGRVSRRRRDTQPQHLICTTGRFKKKNSKRGCTYTVSWMCVMHTPESEKGKLCGTAWNGNGESAGVGSEVASVMGRYIQWTNERWDRDGTASMLDKKVIDYESAPQRQASRLRRRQGRWNPHCPMGTKACENHHPG